MGWGCGGDGKRYGTMVRYIGMWLGRGVRRCRGRVMVINGKSDGKITARGGN
jgi:hypothetical protein